MAFPSFTTSSASQFLTNVLTHDGPTGLPYSSDDRSVIEYHMLALCDTFPSFEPRVSTWNHKDGRRVNLLWANGTLELTYHGATYQIPVRIWLREYYPHYRPRVYLEEMIEGHHRARAVRDSGMISTPYLRGWRYPDSDLVELVRHLSSYLSQDGPHPPVPRADGIPVDSAFMPPESSVAAFAVNDDPKKAFWRIERAKLVDKVREIRLSKQMMESSYVDFAVDELIDDLRKGLEDGVIPLDQYKRSIESLMSERRYHQSTIDHLASTSTAPSTAQFPRIIELPSEEPMSQKIVLKMPTIKDMETMIRAKHSIEDINGVELVDQDLANQTLSVIGWMKATEVMKTLKKIGMVNLLSVGFAKEEDKEVKKYAEEHY